MVLAVDIGNTYIHIGLYVKNRLVTIRKFSTPDILTRDEAIFMISEFGKKFDGAGIASVVPGILEPFVDAFSNRFRIKPVIISHRVKTGLEIKYYDPAGVGADRIANSVGGLIKYRQDLIMIDFGTATTFDVVEQKRISRPRRKLRPGRMIKAAGQKPG